MAKQGFPITWLTAKDPNSAKSFKTLPNLPFLTTKAASYQLAAVLLPTDC